MLDEGVDVRDVEVLETWVAGKRVYKSGEDVKEEPGLVKTAKEWAAAVREVFNSGY
ncbi:MAG: hypothetical protein ACJ72D_23565 [Marmoricola sp.]